MSVEKPIHVPREKYPELTQPQLIAPPLNVYREQEPLHVLEYWRILVARRWTILAVLCTVVTVTMIWSFKQTPIYRAESSIQIDRENPNILTFKDIYQVESSTDDTLRTQFEVLKSRSLARRVIQRLHLENLDEFKQSDISVFGSYLTSVRNLMPSTPTNTDSDPLRQVIDRYLDRLQVSPVRQARIVTVTFDSKDAKLAADVINSHANDFIEQNFQYKWEATQKAAAFLKEQLGSLKANLETAEDRLQAYSQEKQILFTEQGKNTATEKLQQLEEEYTKVQSDRFLKESYDRLIRAGNADALPQVSSSALISSLATQLAQLQREESELAVTFSPDYPSRKRKKSQIDELQKTIAIEKARITQTVQAEYTASVDREGLAAQALERQRQVVNEINQDIIQYNIIKREVDSERQLYEGLLLRLNEAGVSADLRASNIRIVDQAEVPEKPIKPRKALNLALSVLIGLMFGIGLAFLQEHMDDTIKTTEDIDRYLNVPTLGLVPKMGSLQRRGYGYGYLYAKSRKQSEVALTTPPKIDFVMHEAPSSLMAEAYRSIRTSLLLSSPDRPPRTVLITSALPSEGKTVTAVNAAISLTQLGARVVLVDADMRKPRIHSAFALKDVAGLSSVLAGTAPLKDAIQECAIPNLFVLPCGPIPPNPGELIASTRFRQFLQLLPQYFDYVILDSPPVSNVSDARTLASLCDATILVIKGFSTPRHQALNATQHLREAHGRISGAVLNDLDVRAVGTYYSYYYSKYLYSHSSESKPPDRHQV